MPDNNHNHTWPDSSNFVVCKPTNTGPQHTITITPDADPNSVICQPISTSHRNPTTITITPEDGPLPQTRSRTAANRVTFEGTDQQTQTDPAPIGTKIFWACVIGYFTSLLVIQILILIK